jgi:hypothetical protein
MIFVIKLLEMSDVVEKLFDVLSKYGDIYFKDKSIYLYAGNTSKATIIRQILKVCETGSFIIETVLPDRYDEYPLALSNWMKQKAYTFEISKIEKKNQKELVEYSDFLDRLKDFLDKNKTNKDGDDSGAT